MNDVHNKDLNDALKFHFGHDDFRLGQKEIIESIMNGYDTLATLPTGSGKSICYQLPALLGEGITIVVSPLISLMVDQVKLLKAEGIKRVAALNSLMDPKQKSVVLNQLNQYKILYCSPEMLQQQHVTERLSLMKIDYLVIDEAHCISQWGHEFRPDFLRLKDVIRQLDHPTVLALSATATPAIQEDIMKQLEIDMNKLIYPIDRPNITFSVSEIPSEEKLAHLIDILEHKKVPTMIYFSSRKMSEFVCRSLQKEFPDREVAFYHGGMEQQDRLLIQQQFMHDQLDIICCTSAFGMGVNKANIRLVIHYHMPPTIESLIQEVGRAGRDGQPSVSIVLYSPGDEGLPFQLIQSELPSENEVEFYLNGRESGQNPEEFLDESKIRFLRLQDEQIKPFERIGDKKQAIMEYRNERERVKSNGVLQLLEWIQTSSCRRTELYSLFQNNVMPASAACCDRCDFSLHEWQNLREEERRQQTSFQDNWVSLLEQLLDRKVQS